MMTWVSNSLSRVSSPMSSFTAVLGLSSMVLPWRFLCGSSDIRSLAGIRRGGAILSTGLVRGNGAMRAALAVQKIEPGADHDCGTRQSPVIWDIGKHQVTKGRGPNQLGVHERRQDRGRRMPVGQNQQVMSEGAERAHRHHQH